MLIFSITEIDISLITLKKIVSILLFLAQKVIKEMFIQVFFLKKIEIYCNPINMIEIDSGFRGLSLANQCVELVTAFLALLVLTVNILCIVQLIRQRAFCLLHTSSSSHIVITSLFGCNCLVGVTALAKEILLIFFGSDSSTSNFGSDIDRSSSSNKITPIIPTSSRTKPGQRFQVAESWKHFEWYVVIFCLISASLHIVLITVTYVVNSALSRYRFQKTGSYTHRRINARTRAFDTLLVALIWILSLAPAYLQTDEPEYLELLNAVSLMLLACCFVLFVLFLLLMNCCKYHLPKKENHEQRRHSSKTQTSTAVVEGHYRSILARTRWFRFQRKQRTICVWLMASYLVVSFPYMIYYPVLCKVYSYQLPEDYQNRDIIDSSLFLFVLFKCFCDAFVFSVLKGWKREKLKVNFKIDDNGGNRDKTLKNSSQQNAPSTAKSAKKLKYNGKKKKIEASVKNGSGQRHCRHHRNGSADMDHVVVESVVIDGRQQNLLATPAARTTNV